jgi:hypothetical protein
MYKVLNINVLKYVDEVFCELHIVRPLLQTVGL